MGLRAASGTKPSMLAKKVPGADEAAATEMQMAESTPKEKIQSTPKQTKASAAPSILDFETEMAQPEQAQPAAMTEQPSEEVQATQMAQPSPDMGILDMEIPTGKKQDSIKDPQVKNYLFDLQMNNIPFEGSVYGVKFKRDKDGQYYYYQPESFKGEFRTRGKLSKEFGEPEVEPREVQKAGWRKVEDLDPATRKMLHITSSVILDEPAIATALATGLAAGAVTGGLGFFPALFLEMAVGAVGGYAGAGIAEQRYQEKLKDPEESKKLAFLEAALGSGPKPTDQLTSTLFGAGGALIPAGVVGAKAGFDKASKVYASQIAKLKPMFGEVMNDLSSFAEKIGVRLDAKDIVRQVSPNIEAKIPLIEQGYFGELPQQTVITSSESKLAGLRGFLQAMKQKYVTGIDDFAGGTGELGRLVAKPVKEDAFSTQVMQPREDMNLAEAVLYNNQQVLKGNAARGKELAGNLKFDPNQLITQIEGVLSKSFGTFGKMLESGRYSPARLMEEIRLNNPEAAGSFAELYNNILNLTRRPPSALGQTSDAVFVDTTFDALPVERFQSKAIQEQLTTIRKPIEPQPIGGGPEYQAEAFQFVGPDGKVQSDNYVGFGRPPYTDPTTGKTLYGRGDLADRAYYVTGGPAGVPGAPMPQLGQLTESGSRLPGGVSATRVPVGDQIQESLFQQPVGSAAGPKMVESPEKRFLGPKPGGPAYSGLTFNQINEINNQAQGIVETLSRSKNSNPGLLGAASELARITRQFEDDSLFKLAAVRGEEGFAEKVLADKAKYANSVKDLQEVSNFVDRSIKNMSGQFLRLPPQEAERLLKYLSPSQTNELRYNIFNQAYVDTVTDLMEKSNLGIKINPSKIVNSMLTQPESRANIKTLFGDQTLKDLDAFAKMADLINRKGAYATAERTISDATSRISRHTRLGSELKDFLGAFFKGNPTAEKIISTTLANSENLIRKPTGGVLGKIGAAASKVGKPGQMGISAGTKMLPTAVKAYPPGYKDTKEMTLGEFD